MFLSMMVSTSPFKHIPILEDWIFDYPTRLYVVLMTDPGSSSITANETDILSDFLQLEWMISRFTNLTVATVSEYELLLSNESLSVAQDLQRSLNKTSDQIQSVTKTLYTNGSLNIDWKHIGELFADIWNDGWTSINYDTTRFVDSIEFNRRLVKYNNTNLFLSERDRIEQTLKTTASKFANQVFSISKNYKGLGFHFTATLSVFHLKFGKLEVEAVHSVDRLGACSKFKEAFEIFEKESPFRFIGIVSGGYVKLGFLLYLDVGARISFAFSVDTPGKVLINFYAKASILGIETSADVLINNKEIFFHAEGKVWNTFKANLTALADHGKDWNELTFHVHGELKGNSDKDGNFEDSYTDAFRKVLNGLGDSAIHRITQAQKAFTRAASGLTAAQNWLQSKKSAVRSVNIAFNSAFYSLNRAKDALERAKSSLKTADVRLHQAQMRLDKLCKIKTCQKLCVPGLKCQICYKKVWFRLIPYPCCDLTKCMLYIPNPVCIARNIGCRAVRDVAFGALDVTKLPMFVLDDAQVAVSVAQMVVDKSRIELDITLGAIDFAKIGLEGAEFVLRNASIVQEGVKVAVKIGLKVADLISEYRVQSLIEVKNCNFDIDISTRRLSVFAVECDLNAFRLGWIPIKFMINFNRPIQSLWESAKATIKAITDSVAGQSLFGRGKGEFLHEALFKTHKILRAHEDADVDLDTYLNETIDIIFQTAGYENATLNEDYENRVAIFRRKCTQFQHIVSFLCDTNNVLYDIANETYTTLRAAADMYDHLEMYAIDQIRSNLSLKSIGISPMEALRDFNITKDDLELTLNNSKESLKSDSLLSEIQNISQILKRYIEESTEAAESVRILDQWFSAMENVALAYFDSDVCVSFLDCAHYSIAELLGLYYSEEFKNVSDIFYMLSSLEDTF